jgi:hypothetical protein
VPPADDTVLALQDPLQFSYPLRMRELLFPLGFPLEIDSNDRRVLEAARTSFGDFQARVEAEPMRVRVGVQAGNSGVPPRTTFRGRDHLLSIVCDASNFAMCDLRIGTGFGWITEDVANQPAWFRSRFLECMVYSILVQTRLAPIHAACVSRDGQGLLLCAPPGTGKSTLAYGCALAGWTFVTDDAAYLRRDCPGGTILGKPYSLRLKPSAIRLFQQLQGHDFTPDAAGEPHIELRTPDLPGFAIAETCLLRRVVFLERSPAAATRAVPVSSGEALSRLMADLPRYEDSVVAGHREAIATLLQAEPYLITYSDYPSAISQLEMLLE